MKRADPATTKLYRSRRLEKWRVYLAGWRERNREKRKNLRVAWRAKNPEKVKAHARRGRERRRNGTVAKWPCTGERGCPVMMRWPGQVCAYHRQQQPVMTMHDRAIGYQDWWRSDRSLPPLHIYKSRAKGFAPITSG